MSKTHPTWGPSLTTLLLAALVGCGGSSSGGDTSSSSTHGSTSTSTSTASSGTGGDGGHGPTTLTTSDKLDLLLAIDNSRGAELSQVVLLATLPDLVQSLVNPRCVDATGNDAATQPAGPGDACPVAGTKRVHAPIKDIHIGVVTSSLGSHGADACPDAVAGDCPGGTANTSNNDKGHLVSRADPCAAAMVPTYQDKGFLAWDPDQKLTPPGEGQSGDGTNPGLTKSLHDLVLGVGAIGCGFESQLESWYRFLVDAAPYESISFNGAEVVTMGIDSTLLQQRADFLRPDSALAILQLSDEDDCSIMESSYFPLVGQVHTNGMSFHMPSARQECATNPNDPCCLSCGEAKPDSCPVDPTCQSSPTLDDAHDNINLRCWDQKRRFGIDFLYPVDRYVAALANSTVTNAGGQLVPNPIFAVANPGDAPRDPSLVVYASIAGVPWQDIARDPTDLTKGFKDASELTKSDSQGHTTWDYVVGDPAKYVAALDPHMVATDQARAGTDPITGTTLAPIGSANGADPINGHEYTTKSSDLEYACIFPLIVSRDCSQPGLSCDCNGSNDNPLCEPNPNDNGSPTLQVRGKGYPATRQLSLLKALGTQGVTASICAAQVSDTSRADYAYRPVVRALDDRLTSVFPNP